MKKERRERNEKVKERERELIERKTKWEKS